MHPDQNPNDPPITSATVRAAPPSVQRICDAWNALAKQKGLRAHVSAADVTRPHGHVNHHVRLEAPGGRRFRLTVKATDDATIYAAIRELLNLAKLDPGFTFGTA